MGNTKVINVELDLTHAGNIGMAMKIDLKRELALLVHLYKSWEDKRLDEGIKAAEQYASSKCTPDEYSKFLDAIDARTDGQYYRYLDFDKLMGVFMLQTDPNDSHPTPIMYAKTAKSENWPDKKGVILFSFNVMCTDILLCLPSPTNNSDLVTNLISLTIRKLYCDSLPEDTLEKISADELKQIGTAIDHDVVEFVTTLWEKVAANEEAYSVVYTTFLNLAEKLTYMVDTQFKILFKLCELVGKISKECNESSEPEKKEGWFTKLLRSIGLKK